METRLNLDVAGSISELSSVLEEFTIRKRLYRALFGGKGLDFDGYRSYTYDDDASGIDWKASKRANKLLVKQYVEEKDIKVLFVVDVGEHMVAGSSDKLKCEYAAQLVLALSNLILGEGNRVGLILFSNGVKTFLPPERSMKQFQIMVDSMSKASNYGGNSNIESVLDYIIKYVDRSISSVIFVSDFIKLNPFSSKILSIIGSKFETMALMIKDPIDLTLPDAPAEIVIEDPSSGEQILINPRLARANYESYSKKKEEEVLELLKKSNISCLKLLTNKPFAVPLSQFLRYHTTGGVA